MIKVKLTHKRNGVSVYGNKEFYIHLRDEIDRIISCTKGQFCEFQIKSMMFEDPDYESAPIYEVFSMESDAADFQNLRRLDRRDYDLVLMVVDDEDLEKMTAEQ